MTFAFSKTMPGIAVFIRSHKVVNGKLVKGVLMYPGDRGRFKTKEAKEEYGELFEGKAPFLPYHGVGKKYGEQVFSTEDLREAKLEHMERKFSRPKQVDEAFWAAEKKAFDSLDFPLAVVRGAVEGEETSLQCAVREVWEETGLRVDPGELKHIGVARETDVYEMSCSMNRAKWEWMTHQAERLTLTDWEKCPHSGVLDNLGVSRKVKSAYCETQGGPILVSDPCNHIVEKATTSIMRACNISLV